MDAMHWVLAAMACAGLCGVVWLLMQRGTLTSRAAVAEENARAERERREQTEHALNTRATELARIGESLAAAQQGVASLDAALTAEREERKLDRARGGEALTAALTAEKALGEQRLREKEQVFEAHRKALEDAKRDIESKLAAFDAKMKESFGALAGEALKQSSAQFLALAEQKLGTKGAEAAADVEKRRLAVEQLVKPIGDALTKTEAKLAQIESERTSSFAALNSRIEEMGRAGGELRSETSRLMKALSRPDVRGRYGEIQLRRVAELAGMTAYCDFAEQETGRDDEGNLTRPDMVVKLPNERVIAIDAKTNTMEYVEAVNATDARDQEAHLERFAKHVSDQVGALSKKQYWNSFEGSPEFVVMFIPGDQFLDAALSRRPELLEQAAAANVLIATPSTLIGLLRAVAVGWREKRLDQQAQELMELGRQLHERAAVAFEKLASVGEALERATKRYNEFVGSYESRLEPTLRKFEDAGVRSGKQLPMFEQIEVRVRQLPGVVPNAES